MSNKTQELLKSLVTKPMATELAGDAASMIEAVKPKPVVEITMPWGETQIARRNGPTKDSKAIPFLLEKVTLLAQSELDTKEATLGELEATTKLVLSGFDVEVDDKGDPKLDDEEAYTLTDREAKISLVISWGKVRGSDGEAELSLSGGFIGSGAPLQGEKTNRSVDWPAMLGSGSENRLKAFIASILASGTPEANTFKQLIPLSASLRNSATAGQGGVVLPGNVGKAVSQMTDEFEHAPA